MPSIVFMLPDPGFLIGRGHVELFIDGELCAKSTYENEKFTIEVSAGRHTVTAELVALVRRSSKPLVVDVPSEGTVAVYANYSRMWGKIVLSN